MVASSSGQVSDGKPDQKILPVITNLGKTILYDLNAPGVFEMCHHLMSMEDALMALIEEPEAMHELIDYLTEAELNYAKILIDRLHPNALFHHDDWGSQKSSFISPAMFEEFYLPAYKKIYGFYKANGVELIEIMAKEVERSCQKLREVYTLFLI